ncbi:MAG: hypothetical protein ACAH95_15585 [Fimbriimonas sp.]
MAVTVFGQPSFRIASDLAEGWVTELGGQLGPVTFRLGDRNIQPFSVAPWSEEKVTGHPPIIEALRGDFFCMPFGANLRPFGDEVHPLHGATANGVWSLEDETEGYLRMSMDTLVRPSHVVKELWLRPGETAVYCRHTISAGSGPMPLGHHAMVKFPPKEGSGLVSVSPFVFGQVFPDQLENPVLGGYSSFKEGARFDSLEAVPLANGDSADLSRYPAREGFEDLAMVFSDPDADFAWSAVVFPKLGYAWYALKDPRVLSGTILWHSNGGRHYSPWNGRHRGVLGVEDITGYMHYGVAESSAQNEASRAGLRTHLMLNPAVPTVVNYIMGVVEVPSDFDHVNDIHREKSGLVMESRSGKLVTIKVDIAHL